MRLYGRSRDVPRYSRGLPARFRGFQPRYMVFQAVQGVHVVSKTPDVLGISKSFRSALGDSRRF